MTYTENLETRTARIKGTYLGYEDHGICSFYVYLSYSDSEGQAFGGYTLDTPNKDKTERIGTDYGMQVIINILKAVGVRNWEDLTGKAVRVLANFNKVKAIGQLECDGDGWFDIVEFNKEFQRKGVDNG